MTYKYIPHIHFGVQPMNSAKAFKGKNVQIQILTIIPTEAISIKKRQVKEYVYMNQGLFLLNKHFDDT